MSKFETENAEKLYGETPDEEIGSVDELGWAGLFRDESVILIEDSQGFVWIDFFETEEALDTAWKDIEDQYEEFDHGLIV